MAGLLKEYPLILPSLIVVIILALLCIGLLTGTLLPAEGQEPPSEPTQGFSDWRYIGLRTEIDLLRTEMEQLRADHEALKNQVTALALIVGTVRGAAAFCMAAEIQRHKTLRDADFPIGTTLVDGAGVSHEVTQEMKDRLAEATAAAEGHYANLTAP